jgi:hypothetical protein
LSISTSRVDQSADWRDRPVVHAYRQGHPARPPPPSIKSKEIGGAAVGIRSAARAARFRAPARLEQDG